MADKGFEVEPSAAVGIEIRTPRRIEALYPQIVGIRDSRSGRVGVQFDILTACDPQVPGSAAVTPRKKASMLSCVRGVAEVETSTTASGPNTELFRLVIRRAMASCWAIPIGVRSPVRPSTCGSIRFRSAWILRPRGVRRPSASARESRSCTEILRIGEQIGGSVPSVMADVEGFVSLRSLGKRCHTLRIEAIYSHDLFADGFSVSRPGTFRTCTAGGQKRRGEQKPPPFSVHSFHSARGMAPCRVHTMAAVSTAFRWQVESSLPCKSEVMKAAENESPAPTVSATSTFGVASRGDKTFGGMDFTVAGSRCVDDVAQSEAFE